jgi:hypothetical protein
MLIAAFICFASLILGWLLAPTAAPTPAVETSTQPMVPEPGSAPA